MEHIWENFLFVFVLFSVWKNLFLSNSSNSSAWGLTSHAPLHETQPSLSWANRGTFGNIWLVFMHNSCTFASPRSHIRRPSHQGLSLWKMNAVVNVCCYFEARNTLRGWTIVWFWASGNQTDTVFLQQGAPWREAGDLDQSTLSHKDG